MSQDQTWSPIASALALDVSGDAAPTPVPTDLYRSDFTQDARADFDTPLPATLRWEPDGADGGMMVFGDPDASEHARLVLSCRVRPGAYISAGWSVNAVGLPEVPLQIRLRFRDHLDVAIAEYPDPATMPDGWAEGAGGVVSEIVPTGTKTVEVEFLLAGTLDGGHSRRIELEHLDVTEFLSQLPIGEDSTLGFVMTAAV